MARDNCLIDGCTRIQYKKHPHCEEHVVCSRCATLGYHPRDYCGRDEPRVAYKADVAAARKRKNLIARIPMLQNKVIQRQMERNQLAEAQYLQEQLQS